MEAAVEEAKGTTVRDEKKGKRKWLSRIVNFMIYGGWILVIGLVLVIAVLISYWSK